VTGADCLPPGLDGPIVPVMREAVLTVQMVLFKVLRRNLRERYVDQLEPWHGRLAGGVVSNLFGSRSGSRSDNEVARYAADHRELIERELRSLPETCPQLLPILTDALRMQAFCDHHEGITLHPSLLMAAALGILVEERDAPLPSTFMLQVRVLAADHGLVEPMQADPDTDAPA
jgi:hypothetical protein